MLFELKQREFYTKPSTLKEKKEKKGIEKKSRRISRENSRFNILYIYYINKNTTLINFSLLMSYRMVKTTNNHINVSNNITKSKSKIWRIKWMTY